eukprot:363142_1
MATFANIESDRKPSIRIEEEQKHDPTLQELETTIKHLQENVIFKYNKGDIALFLFLFILGALVVIILVIVHKSFSYAIVAGIACIVSMIMAVLLNADNIAFKERIIALGVSYFTISTLLIIFSLPFTMISLSGYITISALLSSWIIIIIMFCYQYIKQQKIKEIFKYLWNVKSLILPVFTHFADIGTDIGATYEYYDRDRSHSNSAGINYSAIFSSSIFILVFARFAGFFIVRYYTQSTVDGILQIVELFLIKILGIEWKLNYKKPGRMHQTVNLIESIFESGPQAIISMYIVMADNNQSFIIWCSSILSILSVASKSISQDNRFFTNAANAKELAWSTKNGAQCNKSRCLFCNHPFLIRVTWRLLDVTSYILFLTILWVKVGGDWTFIFVAVQTGFIMMLLWVHSDRGSGVNIFFLQALLTLLPVSWASTTELEGTVAFVGVSRTAISAWVLVEMLRWIPTDTSIVMVDLVLIIIDFVCYLSFVAREGCGGRCCQCGTNWVEAGVVTTLSIAGCNDMNEIQDLRNEGVVITRYLNHKQTWMMYSRPLDVIKLVNEFDFDLTNDDLNYFEAIASNSYLDGKMDKEERKMVIDYLKRFSVITAEVKSGSGLRHSYETFIECASEKHPNISWIQTFLEEDFPYDATRCIEAAKRNHVGGKEDILQLFEQRMQEN